MSDTKMMYVIYNPELGYYYVYGKKWVDKTENATVFYKKQELITTAKMLSIEKYIAQKI